MLVLTRKLDESITVGNDIKITIIRVKGNTVRLGIEAPKDVRVIRSELSAKDAASEAPQASIVEPVEVVGTVQESAATVTAVVDSPSPVSPRLFVGKVSKQRPAGTSRLSEMTVELNEAATNNAEAEPDAHDQAAPLRVFMRGNRSLTAV